MSESLSEQDIDRNERGLTLSTAHQRKQVNIRLSTEDFNYLSDKAKEQGITLSTLCRSILKKISQKKAIQPPKFSKQEVGKLTGELGHIGNNINQIAKWCNTHQDISEEQVQRLAFNLEEIQKELNQLWQQLN